MNMQYRLYYLRTMIKPFYPIDSDELVKKADMLGRYCERYPDGIARLRIDSDGNLILVAGRNLNELDRRYGKIKMPKKCNIFK